MYHWIKGDIKMKFTILRHNMSYYMTTMGDDSVEITPIERFTVIKVNSNTYVLPYGLLKYQQLVEMNSKEPRDLNLMLEKVITGAGVTKYGYDSDEIIQKCRSQKDVSEDFGVLRGVVASMVQSEDKLMSANDYHDLVNLAINKGKLKINPIEKSEIMHYGRTISPEIHNVALPAFIELIKQLSDQGILDSFEDPALMAKAYREGN